MKNNKLCEKYQACITIPKQAPVHPKNSLYVASWPQTHRLKTVPCHDKKKHQQQQKTTKHSYVD